MGDRPEDLVGVVGLDREPEQILGVHDVAHRRRFGVPGGLPAQRPAAGRRVAVADDDAAHLVRVFGAGVVDHRGTDGRRQRDRFGPRVLGHRRRPPPLTTS